MYQEPKIEKPQGIHHKPLVKPIEFFDVVGSINRPAGGRRKVNSAHAAFTPYTIISPLFAKVDDSGVCIAPNIALFQCFNVYIWNSALAQEVSSNLFRFLPFLKVANVLNKARIPSLSADRHIGFWF